MKQPSIIIIGAGIIGASCAYFLSKKGAEVQVLEQHPAPAMESSGKSAAGIRQQFSRAENIRLSRYSAEFFDNFPSIIGAEAGYHKVGYLFLFQEAARQQWQQQHALQRELGATVELLTPEQVAERFPYVNNAVAGASFGAEDGTLDPHSITMGFLRKAQEYGAQATFSAQVTGMQRQGDMWQVQSSQGDFKADMVLNAAGAFADTLAQMAGFGLPVQPYRRNVYVTAPVDDFPHPTPLIIDDATGVWLRSEGKRFIMGLSNHQEKAGNNQSVDWGWLETLLEHALPRFPFLEHVGLDERACWAGLYAITPDHLPILGKMPEVAGFYNACGFSGHGVQHAPAVGLLLSEEMLEGKAHSFDMDIFRYERFAAGNMSLETNIV